jgi:phospholipase C
MVPRRLRVPRFVATIGLPVLLAVTPAVTAGAAPPQNGSGSVTCAASGHGTFSPRLSTLPSPKRQLSISAALTCSQSVPGNAGVTVRSGKLSLKVSGPSATCSNPTFGTTTGKVHWNARGGSLAASIITSPALTVTDGAHVTFDLPPSAAIASGSFQGSALALHFVGNALTGGLCGKADARVPFAGGTFSALAPNPAGIPIQHVIVLMQENRSADSYIGQLNSEGQPGYEAEPTTGNPDPTNPSGSAIVPFHQTQYCTEDTDHSWTGTHNEIDGGAMDGFTKQNVTAGDPKGARAMGYYDQSDLPYYYALYNTFATDDRHFASVPGPTFPNRLYLLAGTSFGHIQNDVFGSTQKSIFELLDQRSISWRIYTDSYPISYGTLFFKYVNGVAKQHVFPMGQYYTDVSNNALPSVTFIDPTETVTGKNENDEHPPGDPQVGQKFVANALNALMGSSSWSSSAFFLTYDEHGGFYDHVVPPAAPIPDNIPPKLGPGDTNVPFNQYGVRVPVVVASPYAKGHFVSHVVQDHTSITHFIEERFGLPSLTNRDANADPMMEMFDFSHAAFATPPSLPTATIDQAKLAACP